MSSQLLIALVGVIAAFGGIATGIVALRKVGTENVVSVRSIANVESESTMEAMRKFNESLQAAYDTQTVQLTAARLESVTAHEALHIERNAHMKTHFLLAEANEKVDAANDALAARSPRKRPPT